MFRLITLISLSLLVFSCGDDAPGGSGANSSSNSNKVSLSYELKELNLDGSVSCSTEKRTFNSREKYCGGLTQRFDNKGCSLDGRKSLFKGNGCPGTFEETNLKMSLGIFIGRDQETGKPCRIEREEATPFPTLAQYCKTLKDLYRQYKCGKSSLSRIYEEESCSGEF